MSMTQPFLPAKSFAGSLLLLTAIVRPSFSTTFTGAPVFTEVNTYSTVINTDPAELYYPVISTNQTKTPIVLLFQGALVDKADYSNYARIVSSYGFTVVVPNNLRTLAAPGGPSFTDLFPEQGQVQEVLAFMAEENTNSSSPIAGLIDTESLGLLGHSFGGSVGLASTQNTCFFALCTDSYSVPSELKAGIFYGTNFDLTETGIIPPVNNEVPTGLIFGTRDGVAAPFETVATFEQLLNPPKALIAVDGANHYGITNIDSLRDSTRPTLDQSVATETIGRWSGAFLRAHLLNDVDAWNYVYTPQGDKADPNVTVITAVPPVSVPEPSSSLAGLLLVGVFGVVSRRGKGRQNVTTLRIDSPSCISSKA